MQLYQCSPIPGTGGESAFKLVILTDLHLLLLNSSCFDGLLQELVPGRMPSNIPRAFWDVSKNKLCTHCNTMHRDRI